jgi:ubiquinone/menaquinone biosynthesis C-methylase UbiE
MPFVPSLPERIYLLRLNRGPGAVYDLLGAGGFHAVGLAQDAGVLDALDEQPGTPESVARRCDLDPVATHHLLRLLLHLGYVSRDDDTYHVTDLTARWLLGGAHGGLGPFFRFWREVVFPFWDAQAETVLRDGEPERTLYEWLDDHPDLWPVTQAGFEAAATEAMDDILDAIPAERDDERLLDVGGGHGMHTVAFCERQPSLSATVVDRPAALETARENVQAAGFADRVAFVAGDAFDVDLGTDHDLALLFNVVHGLDPDEARRLFARVADSLTPGGRLLVLDQFEGTGPTKTARAMTDFIGFSYRVTLGGRIYPRETVADWLRDAGLADPTYTAVGATGNDLLTARRP